MANRGISTLTRLPAARMRASAATPAAAGVPPAPRLPAGLPRRLLICLLLPMLALSSGAGARPAQAAWQDAAVAQAVVPEAAAPVLLAQAAAAPSAAGTPQGTPAGIMGGTPGGTPGGYLKPEQLAGIRQWLRPAPAPRSAEQALDDAEYLAAQKLLPTARGQQAAEDDVFDSDKVAARFDEAAGTRLAASPTLLAMISRMQADAGHLVDPVKLLVGMGGRVRPFVAHPEEPTCLYPKDMAGRRDNDLVTFHLAKTGSYPSTHSMVGMLMAMVLGEALPRRADAVMARGLAFGESRMVCGFHYYSDVMGGRIAGAALYARLQSDAAFRADMEKVKQELAGAR